MLSIKKFLITLVSLTLLVNLFLPLVVLAQDVPTKCKMQHSDIKIMGIDCPDQPELDSKDAVCCLVNTLYNVRDWLFYILLIVAAIFIIIAGYNFVTAGGDPGKIKTAKDYILWALIGVLVSFAARGLVGLIRVIAGWI
jgi:hypothetical protein